MHYCFDGDLFAQYVTDWIGERGLREVAKEIGTSASTLSRVTRGKHPDVDTFTQLCGKMKVEPRVFFHDEETV